MPPPDPLEKVRTICLDLADTTEKTAWGAPTFRVQGKMFAMYANNHHGDGRIALWCNCTFASREAMMAAGPDRFFIPPYVGPGGWVGVRLDLDPDWVEIAGVIGEAYRISRPVKPVKARRATTAGGGAAGVRPTSRRTRSRKAT